MTAQALPALTIPSGPGDLTAEWLTSALRSRGALGSATVVAFSTRVVGEGEGFIGTIVRIALELEGGEPDTPRSVIGKFPTQVAENKAAGEALGAYEREIRFYRDFAEGLPVKTPRLYYADMDPSGLEGREQQILEFLDRFPAWLIRAFTPLVRWMSGRSKRRYVLLIEDLAPAVAGDQVGGCSADDARDLLRPLARMHAAHWGAASVRGCGWIPRFELMRRWFHVTYRMNQKAFVADHAGALPRVCAQAEWLDRHALAMIERLAQSPYTLLHGDFRLDNLTLTRGAQGRIEPTIFDWQTPLCGPAGVEVAYFLSGNLPRELAAREQDALLRFYCDELASHGVDYALENLQRDYQLGLLWQAWRMILGLEQLDFSNERGRALMEVWMQRLEALLPEDPNRLLA